MGPIARCARCALIGNLIDRRFDGSISPLAVGFVVASTVAAVSWRRVAARADHI